MTSPFYDDIAPVLSAEPSINDQQRSDIFDAYHSSADHHELAQKLATMDVSDAVKHKVWTVKQSAVPAPSPVDKVVSAITRMTALSPEHLELAETHPAVLKSFLSDTGKG